MRHLIPWGCALLCAAAAPLALAAAPPASKTAGMSCTQLRDAAHALDDQATTIRLRIQAQPRPEGPNVRNARELIALMPGVYTGAKGKELLDQARKMDEADAFLDADRVKSGKAATPDQKALLALQARIAELDRAYNANPDCEDRGEFSKTGGAR